MALTLYSHPFSSYCHKVLIALWENDLPFTYRHLEEPGVAEDRAALWPFGKFPVLVDAGQTIAESSIIIEHLALHHPGPVALLPADPVRALDVRFMDRFFDHYVMGAMQGPVIAAIRSDSAYKAELLAEAKTTAATALDTAYAWLEARFTQGASGPWAVGADFTMADCAAAPSLFYADWVHPIGEAFPALRAYRTRLNARPSFARAIEEARPYRHYFPLGAPDQD